MNRSNDSVPLPLRVIPSPYEDLLSIVRRTAKRMGYENPHWILAPEVVSWKINRNKLSDLLLLEDKEDYHHLASLLCISEDMLYQRTLHRFASLFEKKLPSPLLSQTSSNTSVFLTRETYNTYFLPKQVERLCPLCLQETGMIVRLYWRLKVIIYCPQHRIPFREQCPVCNEPISMHHYMEPICPTCHQGDYRVNTMVPLTQEHPWYLGELLFLHACTIQLPEHKQMVEVLARTPLFSLLGADYLTLLNLITARLNTTFSLQELQLLAITLGACTLEDILFLHPICVTKEAASFLLFHSIFSEWPTHFFAFLDLMYQIATPPFLGTDQTSISYFCSSLFFLPWKEQSAYSWLCQEYQRHLRDFHPDRFQASRCRDTLNELAQTLYNRQQTGKSESRVSELKITENVMPMIFLPPVSLRVTAPYQWESLPSILSRAARSMGHPTPESLLQRAPFTPRSGWKEELFNQSFPMYADENFVIHILQLQPEQFLPLTGRLLVRSLGFPSYSIFESCTEHEVDDWLFGHRMSNNTKICVCCLQQENGYDRVFWMMRGVLCCPVHRVLLVERCPTCKKLIPGLRRQKDICPFCQNGSYVISTTPLPPDDLRLISTDLLLTMLHIPGANSVTSLNNSLPLNMEPKVYFTLLMRITDEISSYYSSQQLLQICHILGFTALSLSGEADEIFACDPKVILFHLIFSQWPKQFFTFLDLLSLSVRWVGRYDSYVLYRWERLLTRKCSWITPPWLYKTFKIYMEQADQILWLSQQVIDSIPHVVIRE